MNLGPMIWGFAGGVAVLALRRILTKLEHGDHILPKFASTGNEEERDAVIATIRLTSGDMGDKQERARILALERQLSNAIENSSAGELDGDEFGGGTCTIFMYGPSAEQLFSVVWPILKAFPAPTGSYVVKRSGGSAKEEEERILLDGK